MKAKRVLEHSPEELFSGSAPKKRLNQWLATGICGNDISSSCLYVSAIASEIVDAVSKEFGVPINNIFIGAPEEKHSFSIQDLGGVRVIF